MSEDAKLEPCPFCGGEAEAHSVYEFGGLTYGVSCGYRSQDECNISNREGAFDTKEEAITAWNTRAGEQAAYERGKAEERARWQNAHEVLPPATEDNESDIVVVTVEGWYDYKTEEWCFNPQPFGWMEQTEE